MKRPFTELFKKQSIINRKKYDFETTTKAMQERIIQSFEKWESMILEK
tara:strand:+ start:226 stop:369 length:144 start_codon:yes stop_codon:yes gene_type:complete